MNLKNFFLSLSLVLFITGLTMAQEQSINTESSTITWTGKKVTGSHTGTLSFKSGSLTMEEGSITGGSFVVDMNSMTCTDLSGGGAVKLIGHLKSDDFFGVETHPEATLNITEVSPGEAPNTYYAAGDLTIKGKTLPTKFTIMHDKEKQQAGANLTIDRTKYDIRYGSGSFFENLGDKTIYDEFELKISVAY